MKYIWKVTLVGGLDNGKMFHSTKMNLIYDMFTAKQIGISLSKLQKLSAAAEGDTLLRHDTEHAKIERIRLYNSREDVVSKPIALRRK